MKNNAVSLVENYTPEQPKTKDFIAVMNNLQLQSTKTLLVTGDVNKNLVLSTRNLQNVKVVNASGLTTYDLLNADRLVLLEETVNKLEALYSAK